MTNYKIQSSINKDCRGKKFEDIPDKFVHREWKTESIIDSVWNVKAKDYTSDGENWTEACLVDRLKQHLTTVKGQTSVNTKVYDDRKYYNILCNQEADG